MTFYNRSSWRDRKNFQQKGETMDDEKVKNRVFYGFIVALVILVFIVLFCGLS